MSSNSESQPLPAKRRRIRPANNTDSSDESDTPVLRTLRYRVVRTNTCGAEAAGTSRPVERSRSNARGLSSSPSQPAESESVEPKRTRGTEAAGTSQPAQRSRRSARRASNSSTRAAESGTSQPVAPKRTNGTDAAEASHPAERSRRPAKRLSSFSSSPSRPAESEPVEPKRHSKATSKSAKSLKKAKDEAAATSSKIGIELDAGDDQGEQCPICLIVFVNQEVASPCSCEHFFCFPCLMEWSKNTNTCPVDRKTFNIIDVRPKYGDKIQRHIPVTVRTNMDDDHSTMEVMDLDMEDELAFGFHRRFLMEEIMHIAFSRTHLFSSSSSSSEVVRSFGLNALELLNASPASMGEPSDMGLLPSSPFEPEAEFDPIEYEEPSSPPVVNAVSSPSEDRRRSSSSESLHRYSSMDDSLSVDEQPSPSSVKDEPSPPTSPSSSSSPSSPLTQDEPSSSPFMQDETFSPLTRDEPSSSPFMQEETSSPLMRDDTSSPLMRDETSSPLMRNETSSPLIRDETSSPLMRDETSSPFMRDGTSSPLRRDERYSPPLP